MRLNVMIVLALSSLNAWTQTGPATMSGKWIFEVEQRGERLIAARAEITAADGKITGKIANSELRGDGIGQSAGAAVARQKRRRGSPSLRKIRE